MYLRQYCIGICVYVWRNSGILDTSMYYAVPLYLVQVLCTSTRYHVRCTMDTCVHLCEVQVPMYIVPWSDMIVRTRTTRYESNIVPRTSYLVPRTRYYVRGTCTCVHRYLYLVRVPSTRYEVRSTVYYITSRPGGNTTS